MTPAENLFAQGKLFGGDEGAVAGGEGARVEDAVAGDGELLHGHAFGGIAVKELQHMVPEDSELLPVATGHAVALPRQLLRS